MAAANAASVPTDANFISVLSGASGTTDNEYYMKAKKSSTTNDIYVAGYTGFLGPIIVKYDSAGQVSWARRLSNLALSTSDLALDSSDNIYVVGSYLNSTTSKNAIFLVKYDLNGNLIWQRILTSNSGSYRDDPDAIDVDSSGNIYVIGTAQDDNSSSKILVVKWNSSGVLQWQTTLTIGSTIDQGAGIAVNKSNNSLVNIIANSLNTSTNTRSVITGTLSSSNGNYNVIRRAKEGEFSGDTSTFATSIDSDPSGNVYISYHSGFFIRGSVVAKYDSNLNTLWSKGFSVTNDNELTASIAFGYESVYIAGYSLYVPDILICKLDSSGNLGWFRSLSTSKADYPTAISVTENDLYITGYSLENVPNEFPMAVLAKLPNDGSLTGTYGSYTYIDKFSSNFGNVTASNNVISITQSASSLLETAGSFSSSSISITPTVTVLG